MKCNEAGRQLIKASERLELKAYVCPAGKLTIAWGHTGDVREGQSITFHQAQAIFEVDIDAVERAVVAELGNGFPVNENEFSALVSFGFNVGAHAEGHSTLLALTRAGEIERAAGEFPKWVHAHDAAGRAVVLPGLVRRREAERTLFLTPVGDAC